MQQAESEPRNEVLGELISQPTNWPTSKWLARDGRAFQENPYAQACHLPGDGCGSDAVN